MKRNGLLSLTAMLSLIVAAMSYYWSDYRLERHLNVARSALKSRNADKALVELESAENIDPASGEVQFWMARAYRRQGRLSSTHQCLQKALRLGVSKSRVQREEWLALAQVGQLSEAKPHLTELLLNPEDDGPDICEAYANGYLLSYRFAEAFAVVDAWEKDFPFDAQPQVFRGMVAYSNSSWKIAADHFQRALSLAPQRDDIRLRLANALLFLRNTSEATIHFQQLLKTSPNDPDVSNGWGRTLLELGKLDMARDVFTQTLKTHPEDYDSLLALGQVELNANHLDDALPLLLKVVALNPDDPETRNALATALQRSGRVVDAAVHFEFVKKAFEINSRIQTLQDRVVRNSKDLESRYEISELLRFRSTSTQRIQWLRSIIEIDPSHQRAQAALAEHYQSVGDDELALKHQTVLESLTRGSMAKENF